MPPISRIPQILKKPKPKKKPLNAFVLEVLKLLGGRGEMDTPLTKQHGEKIISARHDLPMHAPLSEKQNIYDIEEKAFETMQKPNATLGDFYKNIGAIDDDDDQQSKNRSEVQKARIDMAKNRRAKLNLQAKNNKDNNAEDHKEDKTAKQGYGWFMPDGHSATAGRAGAIIEQGDKIWLFIDKKVPGGHTFAVNHDKLVDFLVKEHKIPDRNCKYPNNASGIYIFSFSRRCKYKSPDF